MEIRHKLILTGARAGATCTLRKLEFRNGVCVITGPDNEVAALTRYMGRVYKAFPEGSLELAKFQALDREREGASNGAGAADTEPGRDQVAPVSGDVRPDGAGPAPSPANDGSGADAAEAGSSQREPGGDGNGGPDVDDFDAERTQSLHEVIMGLDPTNDEHWTADGKPRIDVVAAASGRQDLTRKVVEAAAPGFTRPTE